MAQATSLAQRAPQERGITLQHVVDITGYNLAEIALINNSVAAGASLQELAIFLRAAKTLGLDPLARQVYWIRRKQRDGTYKGSLQVGIDGFRLVAARTKEYAGSEDAIFRGSLNVNDEKRGQITVPEIASVVVWRIVAGRKCAFTGSARWSEFYPGDSGDGFMWRKMPYGQLAKCAEAQALRKGFPAEMASMPTAPAELDSMSTMEYTAQDEQAPEHRRPGLTGADYDRIHAEEDLEATMPGPAMIVSAEHPLYVEYGQLAEEAIPLELDTEFLGVPVPEAELRVAINALRRAIAKHQTATAA